MNKSVISDKDLQKIKDTVIIVLNNCPVVMDSVSMDCTYRSVLCGKRIISDIDFKFQVFRDSLSEENIDLIKNEVFGTISEYIKEKP